MVVVVEEEEEEVEKQEEVLFTKFFFLPLPSWVAPHQVYGEGTKKARPMPMDDFRDGNEKECLICHCLLHLSSVCCACRPKDRCCLEHSQMLCDCKPSARVMHSSYSLAHLERLLKNVEEKAAQLPPLSSPSATVTDNTSG